MYIVHSLKLRAIFVRLWEEKAFRSIPKMEVGAKFPNNGLQELLMSVLLSENPKTWRENQVTLAHWNKPTKKIPQLPPSPRKKGLQLQAFKGEEKKVKGKQTPWFGDITLEPLGVSNPFKIVMGFNHYLSPSISIKWRDSHPAANGLCKHLCLLLFHCHLLMVKHVFFTRKTTDLKGPPDRKWDAKNVVC